MSSSEDVIVFLLSPQTKTYLLKIQHFIFRHTTPAYRSPEMIDPYSNRPITTKSDIWVGGIYCVNNKLKFIFICL